MTIPIPPPSTEAPRVLLTRAHTRERPDPFGTAIEALGVEVVPAGLTRTRVDEAACEAALASLAAAGGDGDRGAGLAWVLFTSARTLRILDEADPRLPALLAALQAGGARIGAVGPATASALSRLGIGADLIGPGDGRALARALSEAARPDRAPPARHGSAQDAARRGAGRILLPRSGSADPVLVERLQDAGWDVEEHRVYETLPVDAAEVPEGLGREWAEGGFAAAVVTSPSSLEALIGCLGAPRSDLPILVLGRPSARAAARLAPGCPVRIAAEPTPGAIASLLRELLPSAEVITSADSCPLNT